MSATSLDLDKLAALSNVAMMPPPLGVNSNFTDPDNQNRAFYIETSLLLAFAILFLCNRLYVKGLLLKEYTWDDLTLSLGMLGGCGYYGASMWGTTKGKMGYHEWDVSVADAPSYLMTILVSPTLLLVKVSFFMMYLQLFSPFRWMRVGSWCGIIVTVMFYGAMTVCDLVFATPEPDESLLMHQVSPGEARALSLSVPQSIVGLVLDLFVLILPMAAIAKLQMTVKRKIGSILIFCTGIAACVSSALSLYYRDILSYTADITWWVMPVNTVTLSEVFIGVICACMPAAAHASRYHAPSLDRLRIRLWSPRNTSNSRSNGTPDRDGQWIRLPYSTIAQKEPFAPSGQVDLEKGETQHTTYNTGKRYGRR